MTAAGTLRRARTGLPGLLVMMALAAGLATLAVVAVRGHPPVGQAQQVQQIAAGLHCPVCKDLSVADSPAPLAQQMREEIAQKLGAGESAAQIRAGFVAAYGDTVLMSPPGHGVAGAAYYLPVIVLAAGLIAVFTLLRRWLRTPQPEPAEAGSRPVTVSQRRALAKAVARLREEEHR
jgi:cytochrome c-type biogenesis protein CcmH